MKKKREQVVEEDAPMDLVNAAKLPDAFLKKFLDLLQDKVANPENYPVGKITLGELNFLQKHRPELFAKPEKPKEVLPAYDKNDECESQQALAIRMAQHYTNPDGSNQLSIKINKRSIGNWIKLKTADCAKNPPPGCCNDAGTRFSLKAWIAWFDKFMWPTKRSDGVSSRVLENTNEEDLDMMEQREKREAILHRRWERDQKKGEYVHRSVALATGIAAVKRLHLMVKQEDERNHPKLRREKLLEFGATPELAEIFSAWDKEQMRQATDRREIAMGLVGFEFPKETA